MPDDLRAQVEPLFEVDQALGLPLLRVGGVEADDVIGTLALPRARAAGFGADLHRRQGHGPARRRAHHAREHHDQHMLDRAGVKAKFDVLPEQIVDYLALVGDSSDNIPGVDRRGPEDRGKLLAQYGTLESLIAHAAATSPARWARTCAAGLAALDCRASSPPSTPTLTCRCRVGRARHAARPIWRRCGELYARLELRALLRQLERAARPARRPRRAGRTASAAAPAAARSTAPGDRRATMRRSYDAKALERWLQALARRRARSPSTPRPRASITCGPRSWGCPSAVEPGTAAYVPLGAPLRRRAAAASRATQVLAR